MARQNKTAYPPGNQPQAAKAPGTDVRRGRQQARQHMLHRAIDALESDRPFHPVERRALLRLLNSIAQGTDVRSELGIAPQSRKVGAPTWTVDIHKPIAMDYFLRRRRLRKEEAAALETAQAWGVSITTVRKAARQHKDAEAWAKRATPLGHRHVEKIRQLHRIAYCDDELSRPAELERLIEMDPKDPEWDAQLERALREPGRASALAPEAREWLLRDDDPNGTH